MPYLFSYLDAVTASGRCLPLTCERPQTLTQMLRNQRTGTVEPGMSEEGTGLYFHQRKPGGWKEEGAVPFLTPLAPWADWAAHFCQHFPGAGPGNSLGYIFLVTLLLLRCLDGT